MHKKSAFHSLRQDWFALMSMVYLVLLIMVVAIGPDVFSESANRINLRHRNVPPFDFKSGYLEWLGTDSLGRSVLSRLIVASRTTIGIAASSVAVSLVVGGLLGMVAGMRGGRVGVGILRFADILMSFPSLLLALIVLYMLGPAPENIVIVLAITRLPVYIRTARAEVLEIKERSFVSASKVMGATWHHITIHHVLPFVLPTLLVIGALDFAYVMLAESALSFLGVGVQPPSITWGLMVAEGRSYLNTAWWLSFLPGLAIMLSAIATNVLASWYRIAFDPILKSSKH